MKNIYLLGIVLLFLTSNASAQQCAGMPIAGNISSLSITTLCEGEQINMDLNNFSLDSGIHLTWQYSLNGSGFWINGGGNDSASRFTSAALTASTHFRVVVTCMNSSLSSNTPSFIVNLPGIQSVENDTVCTPGTYDIVANAIGTTYWYDDMLNPTPLHIGDSLNAGILGDTNFYAENHYYGRFLAGPVNNSIGGGGNFNQFNRSMIFHTYANITIDTVYVYPSSTGNVRINLVDSASGAILDSVIVAIVTGQANQKVPIPVNFDVPANGVYLMDAVGSTVNNLFRNQAGATYPYTTPGILSVTGNTAGTMATNYWYFFYDWRMHRSCNSNRIAVPVHVGSLDVVASSSTDSICTGGSTTLMVSGAGSYNWEPGSLSGSSVMVSPGLTTTYTVTGLVGVGCEDSTMITIEVLIPPNVTGSSTSSMICDGAPAFLSGTGASTYYWIPGGLTGTSVTAYPSNTTTYTVTGSNSIGCTSTDTALVTVDFVNVTGSVAPSPICYGDSTMVSASGALSFVWMPGNLSGQNLYVHPTTSTTYTVIGTNSNSCTGTDTARVILQLVSMNTFADEDSICPGDIDSIQVIGASSYTWEPGSLSGNSIGVSPTSTTTYTVTGTDGLGCVGSSTITIVVTEYPDASFTYTDSAGIVTFTNTSNFATSYQWNFGDSIYSIATNPTYYFHENGTYTVILTVYNECGSDDYVVDITIEGLSVETYSMESIALAPNPVKDILTFKPGNSGVHSLEVFNLLGERMIFHSVSGASEEINLNALPSGTYFCRMHGKGATSTKKIILIK